MYLPHKSFRPIWDTVLVLLAFGIGFLMNDLLEVSVSQPPEPSLEDCQPHVDVIPSSTQIDRRESDTLSVDELLELERWGDVQSRCANITTGECENVHLRIMRRGLESVDFHGARSIAKWFQHQGDSFGARPGSVIVLPEDAREVLTYCAVARLVDEQACNGLEGTIAVGLHDSGDVQTIREAYEFMKLEGFDTTGRAWGPNYVAKAEHLARSGRYRQAIRTCEKGLGHQRFACGWRISAWKRKLDN